MIQYAQHKRMYVSVSTNGSLLREDTIERLLVHPPDKLIFSMDGLDEESYQRYRVGGTFRESDENLRRVIRKRDDENLKGFYVELQFLVMKHNEHQIDSLFKYAEDIGVDKVTLKTVQVYSKQSAEALLPVNPRYRRYVFDGETLRMKGTFRNTCFSLWKTGVLTWNGDMVACCFDKDGTYRFGNIFEKSLSRIWRGKEFKKFRHQILLNRKAINMCNNCTEGLKINIFELEN